MVVDLIMVVVVDLVHTEVRIDIDNIRFVAGANMSERIP
jgi:hypothetical protein